MGIGFSELAVILVIIMIIFGAGKLPEIGSAFGNSIKNFKKSMREAEEIKEDANVANAVVTENIAGTEQKVIPAESQDANKPAEHKI